MSSKLPAGSSLPNELVYPVTAEAIQRRGLPSKLFVPIPALNVAPTDASVHHALGLLLVRTGQNAEAMIALKHAWELQSDNPRYGYVYGIALNSTGKSREALVVLEETLQDHSFDRQILMALITIHRGRGNQQVATQYVKRLMALSPQDPAVRQLLQQVQSSEQN